MRIMILRVSKEFILTPQQPQNDQILAKLIKIKSKNIQIIKLEIKNGNVIKI